MLNNSKTFRLFISSTFSDFQKEREVLQTKVFPQIKEYCSLKRYTFQPVDLRWGVNNEAQLDQKTLEICLSEVQSCKIHDYPNFLIMLGDRYGWVPLPNTIVKDEFEILIEHITDVDKRYLTNWYIEDKNQLPTSYILKQREDKYIDYTAWEVVENKIRNILQDAASHSDLDDSIKDKYFVSATESEAIEGIVPYLTTTEYQQKLLQLIPNLEQTDPTHIFGFFRNINNTTTIEDKFVSTDYDKSQKFKEKIKKILPDANSLNINTSQITKDKLDEEYLDKFETSVIEFLKHQIDQQVAQDSKSNYSRLEVEKLQQEHYLNKKIENFLGQEKVLNDIQNYLNNDENYPLIICGKSGMGKSSIMAKAIEDTSSTSSIKIIYRFIGATPNSTTTKNLLSSIIEEIDHSVVEDNESHFLSDEQDNFVNFADKVYDVLMSLKDDIVFFIDAVDQLTNDDQFLWLPNKLPPNVKIVISALKDRNYKQDSKYFYALEDKFSKYVEIDPFSKPLELLDCVLSHKNRTLQDSQKEYFLEQYSHVQTPLYVYIAAHQVQYWKSNDIIVTNTTLASTQKEIIESFIFNISDAYHHNRQLVQKVLGYILASKHGLSEYELLELLNTDKDFIKHVAPDTWHINATNDLPLVIWTRLYNHLKPFLSRKNQDDQDLIYFFHREFIDIIENQQSQKNEHIDIIKATRKIIERNLDKDFDNNRWGKLYIELLLEYYLQFQDEDSVKEYYDSIMSLVNNDLLLKYLDHIGSKRNEARINENNDAVEHLTNILIFISNKYKHLSDEIYFKYIGSLHFHAEILVTSQKYSKAIEIEEQNIASIEALPNFNEIIHVKKLKDIELNKDKGDMDINDKWLYEYFQIKQILGFAYIANKDKVKSMLSTKETHALFKDFYSLNKNNKNVLTLYYDQINYYAMALQSNGVFFEAIDLLKDSLLILEDNYNSDKKNIRLYDVYAKTLYILSGLAFSVKDTNWHQYFLKSYEIYEKLMKYNFLKYSKTITEMNNFYIDNYNANNLFLKSENYYKYNIKLLNMQGKQEVEEKIKEISDDLFIKVLDLKNKTQKLELFFVNKRLIEYVFNFDKEYWAKNYVQKLIALGGLLNKSKIDDQKLSIAENLQKEGFDICEKYMKKEDEWYDLYTKNMNNLANTYMYLNKKSESYILNKKNLDISSKLFQSDQKKWFRAYYYALENIANEYMMNGKKDQEQEYRQIIKELESNPKFQTIPDVTRNTSKSKKIQYFDYIFKALLLLGVFFIFKYVILE